MTEFTMACIKAIASIPSGKVATYGQVANAAGNPRAARQVSRVLHSMSRKHGLPWHRVINSKGQISLKGHGFTLQRELLLQESIEVTEQGSISLNNYLHDFKD